MSSLIRRIQRQVVGTKFSPKFVNGQFDGYVEAPPRNVFYMNRGRRLGVANPQAKDLLVRQAREAKRRAA